MNLSTSKEYSYMTKDRLMAYTFIALIILVIVSAFAWWPTSIIASLIAVVVAVSLDYLLSLVMKDKGPINTMSAAVFGLIVALSYTLATPSSPLMTTYTGMPELLPMTAPMAYVYVAVIAAVGMIFFKKLQGLLGRKYVNPAAAAKLVVFLPFLYTVLLPNAHQMTSLTAPIFFSGTPEHPSFGVLVYSAFAKADYTIGSVSAVDFFKTMLLLKYHSWIGGASSIAVIIVGLALFIVARRYIKWRITLSYLVTVTAMSMVMWAIYGGDALLRVGFHLFIGSSIFLAFFMATDPATTPITHKGQWIFGLGLGILTVLIQTYMNFLGGSILALVIMNLTSPLLDKVGVLKPIEEKREVKLPRAKRFEKVETTQCIRCGACMVVCCHGLSPILIKEAFEKGDTNTLKKLRADLCDGCGNCSFVCPSRIDLRAFTLRAKASLRTAK
jgi:electron transport complex protein RnfD